MIPYSHQSISENDIAEVIKVLKSDYLTQGSKVKEFEDNLCKYTGAKYAVVVSSGTAALHLACMAADFKHNYEVITSPITFMASANCILYVGAKPVFLDIDKDTGNIDENIIEQNITYSTRGIIPIHYAGQSCDMVEINRIAKKYHLLVIEDAAHALGAEYCGYKVGSCEYSDMTTFSFHPLKSITTGEGGAIMTNNVYYYEKLKALRDHGRTLNSMKYLGYNYRLTDIQCALGISQLKRIDKLINKRREIAEIYNNEFNGYFQTPVEIDYVKSAWHLYPILLNKNEIKYKQEIIDKLKTKGLGVQVHYQPVYMHPYYHALYKNIKCSNAEKLYNREISLPIYPGMKTKDINCVIKTVKEVFNGIHR